jgi:hypothetical protein
MIEMRRIHQTQQAANSARKRASNLLEGTDNPKESFRKKLIRKWHEVLREEKMLESELALKGEYVGKRVQKEAKRHHCRYLQVETR